MTAEHLLHPSSFEFVEHCLSDGEWNCAPAIGILCRMNKPGDVLEDQFVKSWFCEFPVQPFVLSSGHLSDMGAIKVVLRVDDYEVNSSFPKRKEVIPIEPSV